MLCPRVYGVFMFAGNVLGLFSLFMLPILSSYFFVLLCTSCLFPLAAHAWVGEHLAHVCRHLCYADTASCSAVSGVNNSRLTVVSVLARLSLDCRSAGKHNDKQFLRRQGDHFQVYIRHGIPERDLDNGASCRGIF